MTNLFDYLLWRGDLTFKVMPFNPVDNIIFSQLTYLPLDGIVPGPDEKAEITIAQAASLFAQKLADNALQYPIMYKDDPAFMNALGRADRFKNCKLHGYVNHMDIVIEKQFSALCIKLDTATVIAYRGTDASLVGWKEDFNMCFSDVVPAQLEAVSYLEKAAAKISGPLLLSGHSKGGNLAIYAAASCAKRVNRRIAGIYSNDSPGFHRHFIESKGFRMVQDRIHLYVPQSSIVGMLFEHGNDYTVIKSSQAGILQHELYSWEVTHNDMFRLDRVSQESRFVDKTLHEFLDGLDYEQRQQFIETLYSLMGAEHTNSVFDLGENWLKAARRMLQSLSQLDDTTKKFLQKTLTAFFKAAKNNINTLLPEDALPIAKKKASRM